MRPNMIFTSLSMCLTVFPASHYLLYSEGITWPRRRRDNIEGRNCQVGKLKGNKEKDYIDHWGVQDGGKSRETGTCKGKEQQHPPNRLPIPQLGQMDRLEASLSVTKASQQKMIFPFAFEGGHCVWTPCDSSCAANTSKGLGHSFGELSSFLTSQGTWMLKRRGETCCCKQLGIWMHLWDTPGAWLRTSKKTQWGRKTVQWHDAGRVLPFALLNRLRLATCSDPMFQ